MIDSNAKGDRLLQEAFQRQSGLQSCARFLLGSYAAAEDAVQEATLVVVRNFDDFEEGRSMLAWRRSIVRIEVLRANQKLNRPLIGQLLNAASEENHEATESLSRDALIKYLQRLTTRGQKLLRARFF